MGVHGLWKILEPAHRPVKLETLARKRLAVDASIWIYQFLKAVRDQEGNALPNSHIVGFFRRICKLLFHGIRPVFVFDGGAPVLKRRTITGRKQRREGRHEDAARTAHKLLALQVKKKAEEEAERTRKRMNDEPTHDTIPDDAVYVDELDQTPAQRQQNRQNRKRKRITDQYELPQMEQDFSELVMPNDHRLLTAEELREYAKEFEGKDGEVDFENFARIDFDSPLFKSLPDADRYRILNHARLRSRLRMGYSKEQLDQMFPDRMAFSRFQIERVAKRNELSQRLMNIQGRDETMTISRVAGEKGKEYVLVRNDGPDGGWVMSFVGQSEVEGEKNKPIDVDKFGEKEETDQKDSDEDEDFEDVPIEGLNRLPKSQKTMPTSLEALFGKSADLRKNLYEARKQQVGKNNRYKSVPRDDENSLFRGGDVDFLEEHDNAAEDAQADDDLRKAIMMSLGGEGFQEVDNENEDLQRAIQMSMGSLDDDSVREGKKPEKPREDPGIEEFLSDDDDEEFQKAVEESRKASSALQKNGESSGGRASRAPPAPLPSKLLAPLKLIGTSSMLMKKQLPAYTGSFSRAREEKPKPTEEEKSIPLPPWFSGKGPAPIEDLVEPRIKETPEQAPKEIAKSTAPPQERFEVESSDDDIEMEDVPMPTQNSGLNASDLADRLRWNPPKPINARASEEKKASEEPKQPPPAPTLDDDEIPWDDSEDEKDDELQFQPTEASIACAPKSRIPTPAPKPPTPEPTAEELKKLASDPNYVHPPSQVPPTPNPDDDDHDLSFETEDGDRADSELDLDEADELEMVAQMERETAEHERFAAELSAAQKTAENVKAYETELKALRQQQRADLRDADEVSQTMITECQMLLKLFGLPYITAPMEAEAQCAELVQLGLVDGIVTDDSDVFLFGGTRVYRYMFNDKQTVQCYLTSDLEKEFALDRNRLIASAHLLGSDYTEGIPNVGPVTAIELLAEFPGPHGLEEFATWWTHVQQGIDTPSESSSKFKKKFKKQVAKVFLPPGFPDKQIDEAYLHPEVDSDTSPFEWGFPDLDGLRDFLMSYLGWSQSYTDATLLPVIKDMNRKQVEGTQANITNFFGGQVGAGAWAPREKVKVASGRMGKAMEKLQKVARGEVEQEEVEVVRKPMSMSESARLQREREKAERAENGDEEEEEEEVEEQPKKKGRKRKAPVRRAAPRKKRG